MFNDSAQTFNEAARLQALHELNILHTPPESIFDEAARMAAAICGTPVACVNLLDRERQWTKASIGLADMNVEREQAFCNHTIGHSEPFVVADAARDVRFSGNPLVTHDPCVRFYAGMPLNTIEGYTVGALCVVDTVPRQLTPEQTGALTALGRQVAAQMQLRAKVEQLAEALQQKECVERELRERSLLFSAFMEHTPTTAFIKDAEGRFLYYNRLFREQFAVGPTEWIGKRAMDIFPEEFASSYHQDDMNVLQTGVTLMKDETSPGPEGRTLYWRTHKFRISDDCEPGLLGAVSLDISFEREAALKLRRSHAELEAANLELRELSVTDGLTGLRNRRAFDERLNRKVVESVPVSVVLFDIDHFKRVNDRHGHSTGDEVLRTVARLLFKHARTIDYVSRFGGEEFAVLLPRTTMEQALEIAERLRAAIAHYRWKQEPVTVSAGVATRSATCKTAGDLIDAADYALYRAKHRGRNRVEAAVCLARKADEHEPLYASL